MHVLIIGAGLAGLTCGRILDSLGVRVTLVEASDGIGGRVRSDYADGFTFDRGFQVLFEAYPAARRHLDLDALHLRRFDPGAIICLAGKRFVLTDPLRDQAAALDAALTPIIPPLDKLRVLLLAQRLRRQLIDEVLAGDDETTLAYLRRSGFSEQTINHFFRPFYGGIFLDRSLRTSAKCFRFDFKMLSEGAAALPAHGMGAIAGQLGDALLERGLIRLNTPVAELITNNGRVTGARLSSGEELFADAVVVATPAPEAARLSGLPMPQGALQTITLYFGGSQPVYRGRKITLNAAPDALINNAQMISNVAPEYAPAGRHLLSATVLGASPLSDDDLFRAALADLRRMFAGDADALAALEGYQPLRVYRIAYAQFPQAPGIHPLLPDNRSGRPGLYFAGEFTEASSLNAAMISGEKCAAAVIEERQASRF
ncbi:NAD(P)/FAD-dependent oxidoreductase [Roseiflexus sp.]|uniref:NAD(P)/FAD-dependent oxidoreductase n=1 Tax=Roseiflexus sp. TaxID=2562120 RepID=UPI0021DD09EE|nr:NAD(P)/FAD-dependent oxidoreductase [Roseiflexus sp.]GIV99338.1 MAG: amine oxidase [Roseiflexus sp.]